MRGPEVGPLAEVRLAEHDRAGGAESLDEEGVARRTVAGERLRAGRRVHAVGRVDVVLHQHGNAVQRTTQLAGLPFGVERGGDVERLGIPLEYRAQLRPLRV